MTGFGEAEGTVAGGTLRVEIRSVNHRFFNLSVKMPGDLAALETDLRERLRREFERGHVTVTLRWTVLPPALAASLTLDLDRAREAMARLRELQAALGMSGEVPLELVSRQPEVFRVAEPGSLTIAWRDVEPVAAEAVSRCHDARRREGAALATELDARLALLEAGSARVAERAPERLVRERDRLRAAVGLLLDGRPVDEQRLAQEVAFQAERLDITEELVRLGAHLAACRTTLADDAPVGKRLGFLAQELGREVNTIGSKANDAAIQHEIVALKGELERFREQLENLE
ncbi:MAG: YicC/YloC family endoribonuclease [Gemmatimonadales bacterium]